MANAIFTASESSAYDDRIEAWYHFPKTYLRQVEQAQGDFILYYEPRRTSGPNSTTGRQAYFAIARVVRIKPDRERPDRYYAQLDHFLEFDRPVPFREGEAYYESALQKEDGSTNRGAFGRSVRLIPREEFLRIAQAGLSAPLEAWERQSRIADVVPESVERPIVEQVVSRKFRDAAFRRHVRHAYDSTCAVSGLRLIDGDGRPEVQAAHIRPVEADGPDTIRNGIALTGTVHWLFDRGLLSFGDDYRILLSPHGIPDDLDTLIRPDRTLRLPDTPEWRPHALYLRWHRAHRFKK